MKYFNHSSGEFLQIGDAKVYFEMAGKSDGVPLVILHGGLGNITELNAIIEKLPDHFLFIGIDFRGHGKSELGSTPLTYELYQSDVECVLAHIGIHSFSIFGFSDGGIVGYRLAAKASNNVQALISVAGSWKLQPDDSAYTLLKGLTSDRWSQLFPDSVAYYNSVNPSPDFDALVKSAVHLWTDIGPSGYPGESVSQIAVPTLIVRGDKDHLCSLNDSVGVCARIKGAHFLNIPFAGHEVFKDSPEVFSSVIREFFREIPV